MLKVVVSTAPPCGDIGQLWGKHAMLQQPVAHVVILPTPPPKVGPVTIHPFVLLPGENGDTPKKVLQMCNHWKGTRLLHCNFAAVILGNCNQRQAALLQCSLIRC